MKYKLIFFSLLYFDMGKKSTTFCLSKLLLLLIVAFYISYGLLKANFLPLLKSFDFAFLDHNHKHHSHPYLHYILMSLDFYFFLPDHITWTPNISPLASSLAQKGNVNLVTFGVGYITWWISFALCICIWCHYILLHPLGSSAKWSWNDCSNRALSYIKYFLSII